MVRPIDNQDHSDLLDSPEYFDENPIGGISGNTRNRLGALQLNEADETEQDIPVELILWKNGDTDRGYCMTIETEKDTTKLVNLTYNQMVKILQHTGLDGRQKSELKEKLFKNQGIPRVATTMKLMRNDEGKLIPPGTDNYVKPEYQEVENVEFLEGTIRITATSAGPHVAITYDGDSTVSEADVTDEELYYILDQMDEKKYENVAREIRKVHNTDGYYDLTYRLPLPAVRLASGTPVLPKSYGTRQK